MATAAFYTFGCRLNQADTSLLAAQLHDGGYHIVPWKDGADLMVINSCAVTATATAKCRRMLGSIRRRFPEAYIIFCGCAAKDIPFDADDLTASPDLLLPNPKPERLLSLIDGAPIHRPDGKMRIITPAPLIDGFRVHSVGRPLERTRANLKIQEGCNFNCTYCIVPQMRGWPRSRDFDNTLQEAEALLRRGYRELVITGVNIATYRHQGRDLADLLRAILALDGGCGGNFRIRLGSTEPGPVLDRLIELMAEDSRICRFLHLPMQYGDDGILKRMGRHYDCARYRRDVEGAAERLPGLCVGTDVMVGFPGEDDDAFSRCYQLIESLPIGLMHVFNYSPRPGTPAATWDGRPEAAVAKYREAQMLALGTRKAREFSASQIGQCLPVLIEHSGIPRHLPSGWSDNYLRVIIRNAPGNLSPNQLCRCVATAVDTHDKDGRTVIGELR